MSGSLRDLSVVLVSHNYPPHIGGLEVVVQEEAHRLAGRGASVTVVTSAVGAAPGVDVEKEVVVRRVPAWGGLERFGVPFPVFSPTLVKHLWTAVRGADVVHIHDTLYLTSWLAAALCRLLRRPYVLTQHVGMVDHPSLVVRVVQSVVRGTASRLVARGARRVMPINAFIAADSLRVVEDEQLTILPNGVDTTLYRPAVDEQERAAIRDRFGLPQDERLVLYIGRFVPKKGFDLLVRAAHEDYRIVFVGGDRPAGAAEPRHIFLGQLGPEDVARVYRAADLFVCASMGEAPLTVLECLASGLPALLHDDPGLHAVDIPDGAAAWANLRTARLADLIATHVRDDALLEDLSQRARAAAERAFSWEAHVDRLLTVYDEVGTRWAEPEVVPTRVALVAPHFAPRIGGVESYTWELARALRDSPNHDVVVVTASETRRTSSELYHGVRVVRLGTWWRLSNAPVSPMWWLQIRRLLDRYDIDVVNAHAPVPFMADVAVMAAKGRPVLLTYHAGSMVKRRGGFRDGLLRTYERHVLPRVARRADRVAAVSPTAATMVGATELVPPGVDPSRFRPAPRRAAAPPTVLYVGRMERASRWKGVQVLVEAFGVVARELPEAQLHLVGDGDDVPSLRSLAAELGIANAMRWRGALHDDDLVQAFQGSSVLVLPSLTDSESFGMTLIEAMACGVPVIGSDVGGIPHVIRDGEDGLLVPPGDPHALARTLIDLLRDPERRAELGAAGREAAEARWGWARTTRRTIRLLREMNAGSEERR